MSDVPSNLIPTRITGLPEYLGTSTLGYLPYVIEGNTYKVQFANIAAVGAVPSTREINTGSGLGGGGDLSANRTLFILPEGVDDSRLTTTGVVAGTYGSAENVPVLTVNAQGRVTAATNTPIVLTNYVPTSRTITAGAGLSGGGDLSANRSFAVLFSSTTPEPLGPGNPGVSTVAAREDHVHPAVDLSDTTETQGVLPLSRGGTGNSLSPVVGAIAYSSNDKLYLTTAGNAGQVLTSDGGVGAPYWQTISGTGTVTSVNLTAGTGITVSGGPITSAGSITVTNTAPDQIVSLTGAGSTTVTGTYPNFTITSSGGGGSGTVTSVDGSGGTTGLTLTGGPITTSGTLTLGGTLAVVNGGTSQTTYTDGQLLIGNSTGNTLTKATLTAGSGITVTNGNGSITIASTAGGGTVTSVGVSGGTTGLTTSGGPVTGSGTITLGGTLAVANGGTGATDAATALTNLGAYPASNPSGFTTNTGTVTSVGSAGTVNGITLTGTVTSSGSLTLGGTLSGVDLTSQVTGTLPVANGGTGATVAGTARTNLSAAASGANTDITSIALTTGTISTSPVSGTDIVNKLYADSIASGINFHQSVRLATAAALPANTYNNGTSGVGATLTANANGALSVDGVAVVVGNRILVKNEAAGANNGVYVVTDTGSTGGPGPGPGGSNPYILTRATDFDSAGSGVDQIDAGDFFLVTEGSTQSNTSWVQQTPLPITVGTTAIVFSQFAAPVLYSAGTGLTLTGTVFSITNTGVSASTYGSASSVPVIAVNAQGQVTSASSSSIAIAASQITSGALAIANGGTGATDAATALTNLGAYPASNPSGFTSNTGTVTSVGGTGTVNGITLTGSVTSSGSLTLGGTLSGVDLASQITGTLPVANGGTGATTLTSGYLVKGNGTSAVSASVVYDNGTNVGIGTSSPLAGFRLDVSGSANASGSFISGGGTTNQAQIGNKVLLFYNTSVGEGLIQSADDASTFNSMGIDKTTLRFLTNNSERMRIDSSGNVGIGTSSPERLLDAAGTARFRGDVDMFASVGGAVNSIFQYFGSAALPRAAAIYSKTDTATAGNLVLATSQSGTGTITERMRIDSVGNVGIGTSSPTKKLSIETTPSAPTNGFNIQYSGSEVASFTSNAGTGEIRIGATGTGTYFPTFYSNNTERMRIDTSGNVGIGTASPSSKLHVAGALTLDTALSVANGGTGVTTSTGTGSVVLSASPTFTGTVTTATADLLGSVRGNVTTVAASAVDCSLGNYFTKTASGALTWTFTNAPATRSYSFLLELTNGGTGAQTWPASVDWPSGTAPTLTASGVDVLGFITDDGGTIWRGVMLMKDSK